jgi:hypothetical protein
MMPNVWEQYKYNGFGSNELQTERLNRLNKQKFLSQNMYIDLWPRCRTSESCQTCRCAFRAFGFGNNGKERAVSTMAMLRHAVPWTLDINKRFIIVAPVAKSFGFTIEDTIDITGTLANAGFDASSAATAQVKNR